LGGLIVRGLQMISVIERLITAAYFSSEETANVDDAHHQVLIHINPFPNTATDHRSESLGVIPAPSGHVGLTITGIGRRK
jgi:hypothetical protein